MGINGRSKGNRNERRAAELITLWTGRKFSKVPASGGLHWKKSYSIGDICCTVEGHWFPFAIEVKAHREIDFSQLLLTGKKGVKILEFWDQCFKDAERGNKCPMLLMRYDGLPQDFFFLAIPTFYWTYLLVQLNLKIATLKFYLKGERNIKKYPSFTIMDSREFFKLPYREVKAILKPLIKANGKN